MKRLSRPKSSKLFKVVCCPALAGKTWKTHMGAYRAVQRALGFAAFDVGKMIVPVELEEPMIQPGGCQFDGGGE